MTREEYNNKIDQCIEGFNSMTGYFYLYGEEIWLLSMNNYIYLINSFNRWMREDSKND